MQSLPLCLLMKFPVILGTKNTWLPTEKRDNFLRGLSAQEQAMIIRDTKIPFDPPEGPLDKGLLHFLERRHFSEQYKI